MSAAPLRQSEPWPTPAPSRRSALAGEPARTRTSPRTDPRADPRPGPRPGPRTDPRHDYKRDARQRTRLRAVPAPAQARSIAPFAWLCVSIIVVALGSVLVLNTAMTQGAYDIRNLKIELATLHQERATALTQLEANAAPAALAQDATALGMVPADRLGFVSLASDEVLGQGGGP